MPDRLVVSMGKGRGRKGGVKGGKEDEAVQHPTAEARQSCNGSWSKRDVQEHVRKTTSRKCDDEEEGLN